jgi:hypothetical protein
MGDRVCRTCFHLESDHINGEGDAPDTCWVRLTNRQPCECEGFEAEGG